MRRVKQVLVIGAFALALGGVGTASASFVITSIHQISPHVRAQLKGNRGPRGFTGSRGSTGAQGPAGFVSQIRVVESEHLTLQPGESSYEADPNNFLATCPAGYSVLGTGFNGPFPPTGGFVLGYGNFVGGFFANESSIPLTDVYVDAICAVVPGGSVGPAAYRPRSANIGLYRTKLLESQSRAKRR